MGSNAKSHAFIQSQTDTKRLIELVRLQDALWKKTKIYRKETEELWNKIAQQIGFSKKECKRKWLKLRNLFCKELKKYPNADDQSDWIFFKHMQFLNESQIRQKDDITKMFISEVYKRKTLWVINDPSHYDKEHLKEQWTEIGNIIGISETESRRKWRYLRDKYKCELSECPSTEESSSWCYFEQMSFLKEHIGTLDASTSEFSETDSVIKIESDEPQDSLQADNTLKRKLDTVEPELQYAPKRQHTQKPIDLISDIDEEQRTEDTEFGEQHFFRSLAYFMRDFTVTQRLGMYNQFLQITLDEVSRNTKTKTT